MTTHIATDHATITLNGRLITDLAEGEIISITPVNERTYRINDAMGFTTGNRIDGDVHDVTIMVKKYSDDDTWFNSQMNASTPIIFNGTIFESVARTAGTNGDGDVVLPQWTLSGGTLTTRPTDTRNNQEGNAVFEYMIQFRNAVRLIG